MDHSVLIYGKKRKEKNTLHREKQSKYRKKGEERQNDALHQTFIFCFNKMVGREKKGRTKVEKREMSMRMIKNTYFENLFKL